MSVAFLFPGLTMPVLAGDDICDDKMTEEECEEAKKEAEEKAKEEEEKREKEAKELREKEEDLQKDLEKEKEKLGEHQEVLGTITNQLTTTQYQVRTVTDAIETTELTIQRKEGEMESLEKRLLLQKAVLSGLVQNFYLTSQTSAVRTFALDEGFVRIAQAKDNSMTLQEKINDLIEDVYTTKDKITQEKVELEEIKEEKEDLLALKEQKATELAEQQAYQATKVASAEVTVERIQEKLSELRSDIALLTGKSYSAKDIKEAVEFASKNTRVPKEVLYGFLGAETRFNANTGQCTYKDVKKDAIKLWYGTSSKWKKSRKLLDRRMDIFEDIVDELGYSKDKKVSCTPRSYRGQGGAMGVAQFMSDTWRGYESRIRSKTGNKNPDPWGLTDGVMAMAIKLEGAGATSKKNSAIRNASINYLGAFNQSYYNNILYWSENYESAFK